MVSGARRDGPSARTISPVTALRRVFITGWAGGGTTTVPRLPVRTLNARRNYAPALPCHRDTQPT